MSAAAGNAIFKQPKAVYAVAFACVVSFMGIGLVDPILPALSKQLNATPSQVSLLFTSYLLVTAVAMLFTGWVSSRIGAKKTLITSGTDPLQNPIFAMVEDGALAEEYAALLVEVANAQVEDETAGT